MPARAHQRPQSSACLPRWPDQQVQLQIDHNRNLAGFTYALSSCPASPNGAAPALGSELAVKVMSPVAAPLLLMPDVSAGGQFSGEEGRQTKPAARAGVWGAGTGCLLAAMGAACIAKRNSACTSPPALAHLTA